MTSHPYEAIEVTPSRRRRASTEHSTGLDYSTCSRVDEAIGSRVRSLLLSRNEHCPPRTPNPSDEPHQRYTGSCDLGRGFDFGSAKSVAKLARQSTGRLSVPNISRAPTKRLVADMEPRRLSLLEPILRTSSSAKDLKDPMGPILLPEPKSKFRFPKIVLQDKKAPELEGIQSCIEISPLLSGDDAQIHEQDLECCLPCDPLDPQPSKYLVKHAKLPSPGLEIEASDLACFMGGCEPGLQNCPKHRRRSNSVSVRTQSQEARIEEDFRSIPEGLARLGITVKNRKPTRKSIPVIVTGDGYDTTRYNTDEKSSREASGSGGAETTEMRSPSARGPGHSRKALRSPIDKAFSQISSATSGSTIDAFPLALKSLELAAKEESSSPFSTTVATNFSLPGYKAKRASQTLRTKLAGMTPQNDQTLTQDDVATTKAPGPLSSNRATTNGSTIAIQPVFEQVSTTEDQPPRRSRTSIPRKPVPSSDQGQSGEAGATKPKVLFTPKPLNTGNADRKPSDVAVSPKQTVQDWSNNQTDTQVNNFVREKKSDASLRSNNASLRSKPYNPSLLSGASRTSVIRHALLKPSVTDASPVDTGLPVPPLLSAISSLSEQVMPSEPAYQEILKSVGSDTKGKEVQKETEHSDTAESMEGDKRKTRNPGFFGVEASGSKIAPKSPTGDTNEKNGDVKGSSAPMGEKILLTGTHDTSRYPIAGHLTDLQKAKDQAAAVTTGASNEGLSGFVPGADTARNHTLMPAQAAPALEKTQMSPPPQEKTQSGFSSAIQFDQSQFPFDSSNAAYWGFVPAVREAVQNAVQIAVRNAVQDIVIPPGMDRASNEYRQLVSDSLTRASNKADEYIQQASVRNNVYSSVQDSEATVVSPSQRKVNAANVDTVPLAKVSHVAASYPGSVHSRDQENDRGQGQPRQVNEKGRVGPPSAGISPSNYPGSAPHSQPLSPRPMSPNELECIALDAEDNPPCEDANEAWKLSKASAWKRGSSAGYTAIPTRHSSRYRVLSPKIEAPAKVSVQGSLIGPRKRSYERLVNRGSQGLRSISSAGSLRSAGSGDGDRGRSGGDPIAGQKGADWRDSISSANHDLSDEKLGRKNTVHWLKDLLSTNGPYETRFTALPPSSRDNRNSFGRPLRSQTAPVKPVSELYLGKGSKPVYTKTDIMKPNGAKLRQDKRTDISETFTRTIKDLENLMNEALLIARAATDTPNAANLQADIRDSIDVLYNTQKGLPGAVDALASHLKNNQIRSRWPTSYSDSEFSDMSIHESLRDYSESSSGEEENDARSPTQSRSITVSASKLSPKHSSGWPPTGRGLTPYPPASVPESRTSIAVEGRPDINRQDSLDQIRSADPRSMRTETDVNISKMSTASNQLRSNRNSGSGIQAGSRRMTAATFPILDPQHEYLDENEGKPEFRTLEPFNSGPSAGPRKSSAKSPRRLSPQRATVTSTTGIDSNDTVLDTAGDPSPRGTIIPLPQMTPRRGTGFVPVCAKEHSEEDHQAIRSKLASRDVPGKQEERSKFISGQIIQKTQTGQTGKTYNWQDIDQSKIEPCSRPDSRRPTIAQIIDPNRRRNSYSLDGSHATHSEVVDFEVGYGVRHRGGAGEKSRSRGGQDAIELRDLPNPNLPQTNKSGESSRRNNFSLGGKRHISLKEHHLKGFSLAKSHKKKTIARDWPPGRKRFVATVACISTALIGLLVGIYAGETPAIQYMIVDFHHYTVLGNVFFFIGLAIPTFFFWPLPLLHGRKPYIMGAMSLAMPLLFPQALAVGEFRSPYVSRWRVGLIMSRALMGFCLGFANMNFKQMLTDLFGASLQSTNPHQEHVDEFDVRRHGGGMGIWLGLWTWSALGSIGIGFLIGAMIINTLNPAWGFYVSICIIAFVMLLNVLCPEVRRSAFRRSVAEVVNGADVSRRLARGEVKMHMVQSGPKWWGEEFHWGVQLTLKMLRQPGFLIMALYVAWIYGQQVLITLLLGALMSKDYKFKSPAVGASVLAIPLGALVAIPFQKASIFSRARQIAATSDDATFKKKISWTSHMVRRSIFMLVLPLAGIAYTLSSGGPPVPFIIPILFAALIGFLSNLAMAECHGILMETFDTSDLQPGMTGRSKTANGMKRTNYSSFPRVASAFAITQGFGYLIAAAASGVGGALTRHLGQQAATGIMAGVLFVLSLLLIGTLIRFTDVQIIPDSRKEEMERYHNARRVSAIRKEEGIAEEEPWRPIIIGNPHHTTRRMCLLELGSMSRFSEIRIKNKLVDEMSLEAKHPNQAAMNDLKQKIHDKEMEVVNQVRRSLSRHSSRGSRRSRSDAPEQGDLGGHREMLNRVGSGNGSGKPALSRGASARGSARKGTSMARMGIAEQE
ncbi:hypothetical protein LZ554_000716 [Drepanopeziza brunnea f. sp. 'monogermtubi']|nr:hypothetical protein LZ554_000716 [Drepanopeziza brunnea f. sp. 'monogermtubi']